MSSARDIYSMNKNETLIRILECQKMSWVESCLAVTSTDYKYESKATASSKILLWLFLIITSSQHTNLITQIKQENNRKIDRRIKLFSLDRNVGSLQNRPYCINVWNGFWFHSQRWQILYFFSVLLLYNNSNKKNEKQHEKQSQKYHSSLDKNFGLPQNQTDFYQRLKWIPISLTTLADPVSPFLSSFSPSHFLCGSVWPHLSPERPVITFLMN